jgi:hypothetical protein
MNFISAFATCALFRSISSPSRHLQCLTCRRPTFSYCTYHRHTIAKLPANGHDAESCSSELIHMPPNRPIHHALELTIRRSAYCHHPDFESFAIKIITARGGSRTGARTSVAEARHAERYRVTDNDSNDDDCTAAVPAWLSPVSLPPLSLSSLTACRPPSIQHASAITEAVMIYKLIGK